MFEAVLDDIPAIRMPTGRRRCRPAKVHADKAYDQRRCRRYLRRRGIRPRIARRMIEPSDRLGRYRWTIERTGAWLVDGGGYGSAMSETPSGSLPGAAGLLGHLLQRPHPAAMMRRSGTVARASAGW
jgi:hypothetical protein